MRKAHAIEYLRYRHTASCCGEKYSWPGKLRERFVCRLCGGVMRAAQVEVRTLEEAELALRGWKFVEACADCGATHNHVLVRKGEGTFLQCGACGEELREVSEKEL